MDSACPDDAGSELRDGPDLPADAAAVVDRIVQELAVGLQRIVPEGCRVRAEGLALWLSGPRSFPHFASAVLFGANVGLNYVDDTTLADAIVFAAECLLDSLQTDVTDEITVPWPADPTRGRWEFATPFAEIVDGELRAWYADSNGTPVTEIVRVATTL